MPSHTALIGKSQLQRVWLFKGFFSVLNKTKKKKSNAFGSKNNLNQKETDGLIPYVKNN